MMNICFHLNTTRLPSLHRSVYATMRWARFTWCQCYAIISVVFFFFLSFFIGSITFTSCVVVVVALATLHVTSRRKTDTYRILMMHHRSLANYFCELISIHIHQSVSRFVVVAVAIRNMKLNDWTSLESFNIICLNARDTRNGSIKTSSNIHVFQIANRKKKKKMKLLVKEKMKEEKTCSIIGFILLLPPPPPPLPLRPQLLI